jgi:hypothetical protein
MYWKRSKKKKIAGMMKTKIKIILAVLLMYCLPKACEYEYVCDVIESMPKPIYHQIVDDNPEWDIDRIANYYMKNRDSLEFEFERGVTIDNY